MYVSRTDNFAKLFFIVSFAGLFMYMFLAFYTFHLTFMTNTQTRMVQERIQSYNDPEMAPVQDNQPIKYILLWKVNHTEWHIEEGQEAFIKYDCLHQNCYLTTDQNLLDDYSNFHAVVFNGPDFKRWNRTALPMRRSWEQKYVFFSKNASDDIPICNKQADDFFNWTWSYKLYSDIVEPFFQVKDRNGQVVAPGIQTVWPKHIYEPLDLMKINKTTKTKAMTTIFKTCGSDKAKQMLAMARNIKLYLKQEKLKFDIFGCPHRCDEECMNKMKKEYYFYWVNEGNNAEDYVTDEILTAIKTNTVPVVSSFSDYSKFLPPGSYIDSKHKEPEDLAAILYYAINNVQVYQNFFRWKEHYTIERTSYFQGVCQLCSRLNNKMLMEKRTHYTMFRRWWFPGPLEERCLKHPKDKDNVPKDFNKPPIPILGDKVKVLDKIF